MPNGIAIFEEKKMTALRAHAVRPAATWAISCGCCRINPGHPCMPLDSRTCHEGCQLWASLSYECSLVLLLPGVQGNFSGSTVGYLEQKNTQAPPQGHRLLITDCISLHEMQAQSHVT